MLLHYDDDDDDDADAAAADHHPVAYCTALPDDSGDGGPEDYDYDAEKYGRSS